jgi:ATP-dependent DNA ligase
MSLQKLSILQDELLQDNSTIFKKSVLKKYPECTDLLYWTYNRFKKFHVTPANLKKNKDLISTTIVASNIFDLLERLSSRTVTGHDAIGMVNGFCARNSKYADLIHKIINKDLECRIDEKIINSVYPDLIPSFEVGLANKYEAVKNKINWSDGWYASHKLDGCRCLAVFDDGEVTLYSRQGIEFETLDLLKKEVQSFFAGCKDGIVLDGEICLVDKDGKEDFQGVMKQIRKKDHQIQNPKYFIFDAIPVKDFWKQYSEDKLDERQQILKSFFKGKNSKMLELLSQKKIATDKDLEDFMGEGRTNPSEEYSV